MVALDVEQLEEIADDAFVNGQEEAALAELLPAAERSNSARLWQYSGLLQRSLDLHEEALRSFAAASHLAPQDPLIAHSLARVALEAGVDAVALFERANQLAPNDGGVMLGLMAAKLAAGRGAEAETQLDALLQRSPLWIEGHHQLGQLRAMLGRPEEANASIERALISLPNEPDLWTALLNLALMKNDFESLDEFVKRARQAHLPDPLLQPFEAIASSERGHTERAASLFAKMNLGEREAIAVWHVRHLLRTGQINDAMQVIDREIDGERSMQFWPYASIAWRVAKDPRYEWLDADGRLVSEFDLTDQMPPLDRLADVLRSLHIVSGGYLDQSVRGGTQTDGPLLSRLTPEIRVLRDAIVSAVKRYVTKLPPIDAAHPTLKERRDRGIRFSGSWSVRLEGSGFHASHVHPQGWISSALYIGLPDQTNCDRAEAGWLKIGEPPPSLGLDLPPTRLIEPKPGRLVLFPSWMWHGTVPFSEGERLTVAFDVKRPI